MLKVSKFSDGNYSVSRRKL